MKLSLRPHKKRRRKIQLYNAEENSALRIPTFPLHPKLPDFLRQSLYAVLVLSRQVVYFMYCAVNLRAAEELFERYSGGPARTSFAGAKLAGNGVLLGGASM